MDFLKDAAGKLGQQQQNQPQASSSSSEPKQEGGIGGFLSGLGNKANAAAGGGPESEKNEDMLDK